MDNENTLNSEINKGNAWKSVKTILNLKPKTEIPVVLKVLGAPQGPIPNNLTVDPQVLRAPQGPILKTTVTKPVDQANLMNKEFIKKSQ